MLNSDGTCFQIPALRIIIKRLEMIDRGRLGKCPLLVPLGEFVSDGTHPCTIGDAGMHVSERRQPKQHY